MLASNAAIQNRSTVFALMILIVVALFNTIRQPLIVFMTVPLAIIGVTAGLLLTGQPFGFVALLGFLSLSGMLIKNSVVLLDQIDINLGRGQAPYEALLDAGVSRLRPVSMAAFTTVLGLMPMVLAMNIDLIGRSISFGAPSTQWWTQLASSVAGGLAFATILTLWLTPSLLMVQAQIAARHAERRAAHR